ncbi:hypothetical protein EHI85_01930 [Cronobacter sakazakii]|nr:hypothetical protein [Cronobacter sakazakii]PPX94385.1 hypothetical protein C3D72_06130 [Cronobacter sakazakii]
MLAGTALAVIFTSAIILAVNQWSGLKVADALLLDLSLPGARSCKIHHQAPPVVISLPPKFRGTLRHGINNSRKVRHSAVIPASVNTQGFL